MVKFLVSQSRLPLPLDDVALRRYTPTTPPQPQVTGTSDSLYLHCSCSCQRKISVPHHSFARVIASTERSVAAAIVPKSERKLLRRWRRLTTSSFFRYPGIPSVASPATTEERAEDLETDGCEPSSITYAPSKDEI